ncbi:MAG: dihydrolipoamide acetyltransferase family protein [Veillonellales bacterium]
MATAVNMPKLGLSMKEGIVGKWLKNEGDSVKKGEDLLEVMTDKISNKIEAPVEGTLLKIIANKKAKLPVGGLLGIIGSTGEDISQIIAANNTVKTTPAAAKTAAGKVAMAASAAVPGAKVKISPAARALAEANEIDYSQLAGSGPEGRIVKEDIEQAITEKSAAKDSRATIEVLPYEGMRQVIGENMANSWKTAPKVTHHVGVDLTAIQTLRTTINADVKETEKISVTDIVVKAAARALEVHPKINATLNGDEILILQDINIGVAIAIPDGLVVPVVKNANKKSLAEVSKEIKNFAKSARRNKLDPVEMTGGSFTVTNLGGYGSVDYFTPIINQPESAILGVGRTVRKPVAVADQIVIRPIMGLSLSFDHRVIDGAPAAEFLALLIKLIEQPHKIFI